jgi:hypothetical protein
MIGEKVSGRNSKAMRNTKPERMSVSQSTQRQDMLCD